MGVRAPLPVGVGAAALVPGHGGDRAEGTVREHGQDAHAAGVVVGGEQMAAREREMGRAVAVHRPDAAERLRHVAGDVQGGCRTGLGLADRVERAATRPRTVAQGEK